MSDWNGFDDLDLTDVEADSGERRLRPGRYICKVTDAKLEKTQDGTGRKVCVDLREVSGSGTITHYINVHLPKSPDATKIGLKQLKSLLTHGGHPTPDKPGDVSSIKGLTVGVNVSESAYTDKKGVERVGSELDSWHPYFSPEGVGSDALGPTAPAVPKATGKAASSSTPSLDDDIPFN